MIFSLIKKSAVKLDKSIKDLSNKSSGIETYQHVLDACTCTGNC